MDLRIKLSKQLIKNAFIELLSEKPLKKITVKEICEEAEVNRTTFYKYYKDEYDLFDNLENDFLDLISNDVSLQGNEISSVLNTFKNNGQLTYVILVNQDDPDIMEKVFDRISYKINFKGDYSRQLTVFSFSGVERLILDWVKNEYDMSVEKLSEIIETIFYQLITINL